MKKLIAIAMALTIGLAVFTGCTEKADDDTANPDDNTTQVQPDDDTNEPDENDAEGNDTDSNEAEDTTDENDSEDGTDENESDENKPQEKVAVNISGTIEEISEDGSKIKVDGKWVIITEETRFEDDPDNGIEPVSKVFKVGNTVAGYTSGDTEAEEVTADVIYSNE
ncbi:hypothetical protein HZI73_18145 [Vallitalea pronyensis]|uniref:DUF5666 domain-containing protein n=1 Tax=Vallitalea pronyensis TaxID=1348613 RepID=A0A8J8MM91_9FIRM|nr:hypothetical protein [Vallitalea pronyensis]QUI24096.1 hypothetical protein HZI73_18145 [Vallitalea pronyensis]